ncbi:MAG: hypothetical protein ABNH26_08840 [Celeribacter sp.]|jgi:hypothetical protein
MMQWLQRKHRGRLRHEAAKLAEMERELALKKLQRESMQKLLADTLARTIPPKITRDTK